MYGTQTYKEVYKMAELFENDVKMYGTQTYAIIYTTKEKFENDVKMYGTQTAYLQLHVLRCLRMM